MSTLTRISVAFLVVALCAGAMSPRAGVIAGGRQVSSGSGSWTDTFASPETGTADNTNAGYAQRITLPSGTVTKLRAYKKSGDGNTSVKLALYDGSRNLLASVELSSPVAAGEGWIEATISPTVVSAGIHFVGFKTSSGGTSAFMTSYKATAGVTSYYTTSGTVSYAAFPPNPFPSTNSFDSIHYAFGAFVQ